MLALPAQNLATRNGDEDIFIFAPFLPSLGYAFDLVLGGKALPDGCAQEARLEDSAVPTQREMPRPLADVPPRVPSGVDLVGGESGLARPHVAIPPGVGLATVGLGDSLVDVGPAGDFWVLRVPGEALVVSLTGGDEATGFGDAAHLAEDADGVINVLEDLVAVDDVEGVVLEGQGVGVDLLEADVGEVSGLCERGGLGQDALDRVAARDVTLGHERG